MHQSHRNHRNRRNNHRNSSNQCHKKSLRSHNKTVVNNKLTTKMVIAIMGKEVNATNMIKVASGVKAAISLETTWVTLSSKCTLGLPHTPWVLTLV